MKIAFLGGGNMATAIIGGLLKQGAAARDIQVVEPDALRRGDLQQSFKVNTLAQFSAPILSCEVLVLAVKPQQMQVALAPLRGQLSRQVVLSIAAGISITALRQWLDHPILVRAMPNTPALIGKGISVLAAAAEVSMDDRRRAQSVLEAVGSVLWVEDEMLLHAVTAVSGSGPAYVFYLIEALQRGAQEAGLPVDMARQLALQTFVGASSLAQSSDQSLATLRQQVTSPGGTTERALAVMNEHRIDRLFIDAILAAKSRSEELGSI